MPCNPEWDVPHAIVSPKGTLEINQPGPVLSSGRFPLFLITPPYSIVPASLRTVVDNLSQADGVSLQPPFIGGMVATLKVTYWVQPTWDTDESRRELACGQDLREMDERLMLHLNALREFSSDPPALQQLQWSPTGAADRALTDILLSAWPTQDFLGGDQGGVGMDVTFAVATPFPYAVSAATVDTSIADGGTAVITNNGDAKQSPVMRAFGPSTGFAITNERTAEVLSYDSSLPGASSIASGHYAEIDFFKGTVLLDGNPNDDLIAGLDPSVTDFFHLLPGTQTIAASGAAVLVVSQDAYA